MKHCRRALLPAAAGLTLLALVLATSSSARAEFLQPIDGIERFYNIGTGTVALLPHATDREDCENAMHFHVLPADGAYNIPRQSQYWFIVSNQGGDTVRYTYLGVELVLVLSVPRQLRLAHSVVLYRNNGWRRTDDPKFDPEAIRKAFPPTRPSPIEEFFRVHMSGRLKDMDQLFFQWDGTPIDSDENSWKAHQAWVPSRPGSDGKSQVNNLVKDFQPPFSPSDPVQLEAYLLRFAVSPSPSRKNRVCFKMRGSDVKGAYIRLFAPNTPDFDRNFFIRFQ